MGKLKEHAVRALCYAGLSKEEFDAILPDIRKEGRMNLVTFSAIACAFMLGMLILSLFIQEAAANRWLYLPVMIALVVIFAVACLVKESNATALLSLIYAFVITLFLFGLLLGTYASPDKQAVTFIVLLLTVPMLFTDRPIRMIVCIVAAVVYFVIAAVHVKHTDLLVTDIGDAVIFGMISIVVSTYMMRVKCQRFLYAQKVATLSETDLLTGLRNRNSYEQQLEGYAAIQHQALSCIYVDINGLHELNDTKGHAAGDQMLKAVGKTLQAQFGKENTFRIGGDEFVALLIGKQEQDVQEQIAQCKRILAAHSYHISVGYSQGNCSESSPTVLIREAEERMYQEKNSFYLQNGLGKRKRV